MVKLSTSFFFPAIVIIVAALTFLTNPFQISDIDGWYQSRLFLFPHHTIGFTVHSPIGIPAIWYLLIDMISWGKTTYHLIHLANYLFIAIESILIWRLLNIIQTNKIAIATSTLFLVTLLSTQIANTLYSENLYILLLTLVFYLHAKNLLQFSPYRFISLLMIIAAMAMTWIIPGLLFILLIPSTIKMAKLTKKQILAGSIVIITVVLIFPVSNYFRFGRIVISDSIGRHLWNAVCGVHSNKHIARENQRFHILLENNIELNDKKNTIVPGYQFIESRLLHNSHPGYFDLALDPKKLSRELEDIVIQGVKDYPLEYIIQVINKTVNTYFSPYKYDDKYPYPSWKRVGPLDLPSIIPTKLVTNAQVFINKLWEQLFIFIIVALTLLWIIALTAKSEKKSPASSILILCITYYFLSRFAIAAIEAFNARYLYQVMPLIFMATGITINKLMALLKTVYLRTKSVIINKYCAL